MTYLDQEADALYRQGDELGDNPALSNAIDRYRALPKRWTRERVPLQWATTQNNLGAALSGLGERAGDRVKFAEAREKIEGAFDIFMQAGQEQHRGYLKTGSRRLTGRLPR